MQLLYKAKTPVVLKAIREFLFYIALFIYIYSVSGYFGRRNVNSLYVTILKKLRSNTNHQ